MDQGIGAALARIAEYRDRFSAGALVIGFVSFVMAMWTAAPGLDVTLPLVGGTQIGLNLGYVLMAGIPTIALAIMWMMAPLLSMRRLQSAVLEDIVTQQATLHATQWRELLGPFGVGKADSLLDEYAYRLSAGIRYFIFFICPLLSQIWIAEEYFRHLYAYNREAVTDSILRNSIDRPGDIDPSEWRINPKFKITLAQYLAARRGHDQSGRTLDRYTVPNSDLERRCAQLWVLDRLQTLEARGVDITEPHRRLVKDLKDRTKDMKCTVDSFPRYELALNSWLNIVSLLLTIWMAAIGWRLYRSHGIEERLNAASALSVALAPNGPESSRM